MGPATAVWSRIYSRDAAGMDCALRRDPGGNDACRKNTVTNRPAPKASSNPFQSARLRRYDGPPEHGSSHEREGFLAKLETKWFCPGQCPDAGASVRGTMAATLHTCARVACSTRRRAMIARHRDSASQS